MKWLPLLALLASPFVSAVTLDEVRQIQDAGRASRAQAEAELTRIEDELMQKLLEMKG